MRRTGTSLLFLAALACIPRPAMAQDGCTKPLERMTSVAMTRADSSGRFTIPVSFDGVEKQFLFDTGTYYSSVAPGIVDALKLPRLTGNVKLYAVNGATSDKYTNVHNFAIGSMRAASFELMVSANSAPDGLFSPLVMNGLDFDLDFANQKMSIFSSNHCDGKVIYWPAAAVAVVPATLTPDHHLSVPVTIDGHEILAIIDTGSTTSTMRPDIAKFVYGLTPASPDMKVVGHIDNDPDAPFYTYPFKTLSFAGVTVTNPEIVILTDVMNKKADHSNTVGSMIARDSDTLTLPKVIVGMDVLSHLHLYFAFGERKLYVTEAGTPTAPAAPAR